MKRITFFLLLTCGLAFGLGQQKKRTANVFAGSKLDQGCCQSATKDIIFTTGKCRTQW